MSVYTMFSFIQFDMGAFFLSATNTLDDNFLILVRKTGMHRI